MPRHGIGWRRWAAPLIGLAVVGLLAAACGGSDGEGAARSAPTDARSQSVAETAPPEEPTPPTDAPTPESAGAQSDVALDAPDGATPESPEAPNEATDTPKPDEDEPAIPDDAGRILEIVEYAVPAGSRPHDVAPAVDGGVWYTAQGAAALGWLDPASGETRHIDLGAGSRPHGVIVGPDGAPWITDGGLNAIVRVDPATDEVTVYALPVDRPNANLNTATFDASGQLWFTGQNGVYGRLDPASGAMTVFDAPRGTGPYGIATTPDGAVYYASLAGSYVGRIDLASGEATVLEPPTPGQGSRRVWSDSLGRIWVSEWNAGALAMLDPQTGEWREWPLPGASASAYAVYVDELDLVWLSDFGSNALLRFDPATEQFESYALPSNPGNVRQLLGRTGELWAPESAADRIVVVRFVSLAS